MKSNRINIKRLVIENFQSHQHTELDFSDGFNIISGPSDYGKSAVIRSIKWVLYNEPRGTEYIRHGASTAKVTMELNNGYIIARERSQSKNRYILTYPDGKSTTFEGFGNEIPLEVIRAHGIPKVKLDSDSSSSLNLGEQLEGPFLLSETGATRAKAIGRLIGLHIIDKAIRNCNVDIRRENQSGERTRSEIEETEVKLEEYRHLKVAEERLQKSEAVINKTEGLILRENRIEVLNREFNNVNTEYENVKEKYRKLSKLKECEIDIKSCELDQKNLSGLERIRDALQAVEAETGRLSEVVEKSSGLKDCTDMLNDIANKKTSFEKLYTLKASIDKIDSEAHNSKAQLESTKNAASLEQTLKMSEEKNADIEKLGSFLKRFSEIAIKSKELNEILVCNEKIDRCSEISESINQKIAFLNKIENIKAHLDTVDNYIKEGNKYMESSQKDIEASASKYIEALKDAGTCPLCGGEISDNILNDILKHYGEA